LLAGVITRLSNDAPAPLLLKAGAFWPGKSDLERAFPATPAPTNPDIEKANGNKNVRFFITTAS
jgi:hypothetical protein